MSKSPPRSVRKKKLTVEEELAIVELGWYLPKKQRPKTRADCVKGLRPCPFVSCSHHLYLDVKETIKADSLRINWPCLQPDEMEETCVLDAVDRNLDGMTLEEIGNRMNITRERVRQIEKDIITKLRRRAVYSPRLKNLLEVYDTLMELAPYEGFDF